MQWKELLTGAMITLGVTVLGGLVVYYLTQSNEQSPAEELTFQLGDQVAFEGRDNRASIGSVKFANIGNQPAENVRATFLAEAADIIEFKVTTSDGATVERTISENRDSATIRVPTLLPSEVISVTYLLSQEAAVSFQLRSSESIGERGPVQSTSANESSRVTSFLTYFLPIAGFVAVIAGLYSSRKLTRAIKDNTPLPSCRNNIGFVLLHAGAVDEAEQILRAAVERGEDGSYALSNLAAADALLGHSDVAETYISAAYSLARTPNERAVWELNDAIIRQTRGDADGAQEALARAHTLSPQSTSLYIERSKTLHDLFGTPCVTSDAPQSGA